MANLSSEGVSTTDGAQAAAAVEDGAGTIAVESAPDAVAAPAPPALVPLREVADLKAISDMAVRYRARDAGDALFFHHVLNNGAVKERNIQTVARVLDTAVDFQHHVWPRELKNLFYGLDVLDVGCGATLHGPVFRALGANSYTGIDRAIDPLRKRFRSRRVKATVPAPVSLSDVVRLFGGLSYFRGEEIGSYEAYDLALLQASTHTLPNLEQVLVQIHRALRPGGQIWFKHHNFFGWAGHESAPKDMAAFKAANPEHAALVDWGHVRMEVPAEHRFATNYNRIPLSKLRPLVDRYFEVVTWSPVREKASIAERLTPELRASLKGYTDDDLLIKSVTCLARKRED